MGDYRRLDDLLAFAAGCDVVTFDHEHVPGEHLAALAAAGAVLAPGAGRAPVHPGQAGHAGRADPAGRALPALRAGRPTRPTWPPSPPRRAGRWCSRRSAAATTAAASGCATRPEAGAGGAGARGRAARRGARRRSTASWPRWSPGRRTGRGRPTRWCRPCSATGSATRCWRPRPGCPPAAAEDAQRLALELADALGVTGLLAVELFETPARPAGQRAGHAAAQQRALDHRGGRDVAVRAAPAGRAGPAAGRAPAGRAAGGHGQRVRGADGPRTCTTGTCT